MITFLFVVYVLVDIYLKLLICNELNGYARFEFTVILTVISKSQYQILPLDRIHCRATLIVDNWVLSNRLDPICEEFLVHSAYSIAVIAGRAPRSYSA